MQGFKVLIAVCALIGLVSAGKGRVALPQPHLNRCLGHEDGVFLPVPGSCSKYIICLGGIANELDCGTQHFNAMLSTCDVPERAGCIDGPPVPVATIAPPRPITPPCYAVASGISLPVPGNPRQYYYCMHNKAFLKDCGNLYFIPKHSACGLLSDGELPIPVPPVKPVVPPTIHHEADLTPCHGQANGINLPVPGNHRQYYYCMNNKAFLKDCGNLVFDARFSACIASPDAQEVPHPIEHTIVDKYSEIAQRVCKNQVFGARVAYPGSCSLYFICTFNTGFLKSCSWREFNSRTASCDLPQNVQCKAHY